MKKDYTRNVSPIMMNYLVDDNGFAPFVDFVKTSGEDLALCFRGNDSANGCVDIYRNNHMIWELYLKNGKIPAVKINLDHARFMYDWFEKYVYELMDMGFECSEGNYECIKENYSIVKRNKKKNKNGGFSYKYSAGYLYFYPTMKEETEAVVKKSYGYLKEMQEAYFNPPLEKW